MCVCVTRCSFDQLQRLLGSPAVHHHDRHTQRGGRGERERERRGVVQRTGAEVHVARRASYRVSDRDVERRARPSGATAHTLRAGRSCPTCRASCRRAARIVERRRPRAGEHVVPGSKPSISPPIAICAFSRGASSARFRGRRREARVGDEHRRFAVVDDVARFVAGEVPVDVVSRMPLRVAAAAPSRRTRAGSTHISATPSPACTPRARAARARAGWRCASTSANVRSPTARRARPDRAARSPSTRPSIPRSAAPIDPAGLRQRAPDDVDRPARAAVARRRELRGLGGSFATSSSSAYSSPVSAQSSNWITPISVKRSRSQPSAASSRPSFLQFGTIFENSSCWNICCCGRVRRGPSCA